MAEAQYMKTSAAHAKQRTLLTLQRDAQKASSSMEDARRRMSLFRDSLIPKAEQSYESLLSSYSTAAGGDFINLLDSERELLAVKLELLLAQRDLQLAAASLERTMAGPWEKQSP
jgi:outer membrane protein TolC